jgi:NAD-dependent deacetylase
MGNIYFWVMNKKKLVVLTGAGMSAESGLKTFRDSDGLWEGYDINEVATTTAWRKNPALVLEFYNMRRKNVRDAKPNAAHYGLASLQENFDVYVVTQNIDDLHERAGTKMYCIYMGKF